MVKYFELNNYVAQILFHSNFISNLFVATVIKSDLELEAISQVKSRFLETTSLPSQSC